METKTLELVSLDPPAPQQARAPRTRVARLKAWASARRWLIAVVWVPTLLAAVYFLLIAADRYETETRFVVRSPSSAAASQLSSLVQGSSIMRSSDDAYIVHAYLKSRDVVRKLAEAADLRARLQRPEADLLWTYPGLLPASEERLWRHFQSLMNIDYDQTTGITTLKVQAFRAADARDIAQAMLDDAEKLINAMSDRAQQSSLDAAKAEAEMSRERARVALERISDFRRRHALLDPSRASVQATETITRLAVEVANLNAELTELRKSSPDSPQANAVRQRIAALEEQIKKERSALAGNDNSLAPLIAEFERLMLEREFAHTSFTSAQTSYNIARLDAERQRLFLDRISAPTLVDYPKYPYRIFGILMAFIVAWTIYKLAGVFVVDAKGHAGR